MRTRSNKFIVGLLTSTILIGTVNPSWSYYSKTDYTETFEIQPNQTAFLIPLQGANKESQAQLDSQAYLDANKVQAKRVIIPHAKLSGSGGVYDYYVPTAKLILVDRTPFNRAWTDDITTGTSPKKEGFHFESQDSIGIETDVAIAASIKPEDAAKYLYYFGTTSIANPLKYDTTAQYQSDAFYAQSYSSVAYARSLEDVMDTIGHGQVQVALAQEFGSRIFQEAYENKAIIMTHVSDVVKKYFAERGVTIDYVGYAKDLTYEKKVQDAINSVFIAKKQAESIQQQESVLGIRKQIAQIGVIEKSGDALLKWTGTLPGLPSFFVIPSNVWDWATGLFTTNPNPQHKEEHK